MRTRHALFAVPLAVCLALAGAAQATHNDEKLAHQFVTVDTAAGMADWLMWTDGNGAQQEMQLGWYRGSYTRDEVEEMVDETGGLTPALVAIIKAGKPFDLDLPEPRLQPDIEPAETLTPDAPDTER